MTGTTRLADDTRCPCGTGLVLGECCGPLLDGRPAPTAETLMRSRFTAFAVGDAAYLRATWRASTRPRDLVLDDDVEWRSLEIRATSAGGPFDDAGVVEFVARYRQGGVRGALHETSRFVREGGRWSYVDGTLSS